MVHFDEARREGAHLLAAWVDANREQVDRAVLIDDIRGALRAVLWLRNRRAAKRVQSALDAELSRAVGSYWSGELWVADVTELEPDVNVYEAFWNDASPISDRVRLLDRLRGRATWLGRAVPPPWALDDADSRPPIVAFHSYKGGVGRTTALAAVALSLSRAGHRVAAVDFDLDAPGLGAVLPADEVGSIAPWGVADYLIERPLLDDLDLADYYHTVLSASREGELIVFPAGRVGRAYLRKLARLDLEPGEEAASAVDDLLIRIRDELSPDFVLLDMRAGLSEAAGLALAGLAHLVVAFGTNSPQSWDGLTLVVRRLGKDMLAVGQPQGDCVIVQSMVPLVDWERSIVSFADRARDVFAEHYYAESDGSLHETWSLDDLDSSDAPHAPIPIPYNEALATIASSRDLRPALLDSSHYRDLSQRIATRFAPQVMLDD